MERKQYIVSDKTYTLTLKQNLNGTWEAVGYDSACNEVIRASQKASRHDAQFAVHMTLYEMHNKREDQLCERDCDKGWQEMAETRPCPHRNPDGNPCPGTQTYRFGRPISAAGIVTPSGADTANMTRRSGWDCSEEYPEHFDEA